MLVNFSMELRVEPREVRDGLDLEEDMVKRN
jgi:hypothetical protein